VTFEPGDLWILSNLRVSGLSVSFPWLPTAWFLPLGVKRSFWSLIDFFGTEYERWR